MNTLNIIFSVALIVAGALIVSLAVKVRSLNSELYALSSKSEVTDDEIAQLARDIEWLKEIKREGKLY
jgi:cell division protein FtsL